LRRTNANGRQNENKTPKNAFHSILLLASRYLNASVITPLLKSLDGLPAEAFTDSAIPGEFGSAGRRFD
jgi:hypothetical protein